MNKDLYFEYIEDFADYIVEKVESDEELFLTVVGKFEEIKNIIKEMILVADVDFEGIKLYSADINGYTDEYVLDCWCDDGIVWIGCEPAKEGGKYWNLVGDETYLLDNSSSKVISACEDTDLYFVNIDEECDCADCCQCDYCDAGCVECYEDEDIHGVTAKKSTGDGYFTYSFYTNNTLSDDEVDYLLRGIWF